MRVLRMVRTMIIMNIFLLHVPTTVLTYAANLHTEARQLQLLHDIVPRNRGCGTGEVGRVREHGCGHRMLRLNQDHVSRKTILQLLAVNVSCILMDIALMIIEFRDFYIDNLLHTEARQLQLLHDIVPRNRGCGTGEVGRVRGLVDDGNRPILRSVFAPPPRDSEHARTAHGEDHDYHTICLPHVQPRDDNLLHTEARQLQLLHDIVPRNRSVFAPPPRDSEHARTAHGEDHDYHEHFLAARAH
jgi:hypothetical protein